MANISALLEIIRTAHLGRDMRQALHDAIESVNNDTETALGKSLTFTTATRKLSLKAKDGTALSEVVIPGGGSGGGSVDSVNGVLPDENGNVEVNLNDINDVNITSAANGQILKYDETSGKWVNGNGGGGGTTDYSDLTNKPQINGVTLSGNKTSADLGISGGGSNPNLLDNAWFTVNQRGASGSQTSGYQLDRWIVEAGTITINNDGTVTYGASSYQVQYANLGLVGKQVTFSALLSDGTIESGTFNVLANTYNNKYVGNHAFSVDTRTNMQRNGSTEKIFFYNDDSSNTVTIKALKLELGSQSTLALDTAPNYATELLKCQRYFRQFNAGDVINGYCSSTTDAEISLMLSVPMRAVPTLSTSGVLVLKGSFGTIAVSTLTLNSFSTTQCLRLQATSSGLTAGSGCVLGVSGSSIMQISAEL